jgi:hypothetical protein
MMPLWGLALLPRECQGQEYSFFPARFKDFLALGIRECQGASLRSASVGCGAAGPSGEARMPSGPSPRPPGNPVRSGPGAPRGYSDARVSVHGAGGPSSGCAGRTSAAHRLLVRTEALETDRATGSATRSGPTTSVSWLSTKSSLELIAALVLAAVAASEASRPQRRDRDRREGSTRRRIIASTSTRSRQLRAAPSPCIRSRISGGFSMIWEKRTTVTVSSIDTLRP